MSFELSYLRDKTMTWTVVSGRYKKLCMLVFSFNFLGVFMATGLG